jgi:predicted DNA-binding transcriptional regulator AlpA
MIHQDETRQRQWVSARQLRRRYGGRSHMWVQRRLQFDPDFPKPIKIGRLRFWDLDALEAYEQSRVAEAT